MHEIVVILSYLFYHTHSSNPTSLSPRPYTDVPDARGKLATRRGGSGGRRRPVIMAPRSQTPFSERKLIVLFIPVFAFCSCRSQ